MRILVLAFCFCLPIYEATAQTFGLGEELSLEVAAHTDSLEDTFGLGEVHTTSVVPVRTTRIPDQVRVVGVPPPKPSVKLVVDAVPAAGSILSAPYNSPPGYHRHVMVDGSIIEHHDSNYGDPVAHAGVAGRNWPKYYGPQAPTTVSRGVSVSTCPGDVCPTNAPVRRGLFFRR